MKDLLEDDYCRVFAEELCVNYRLFDFVLNKLGIAECAGEFCVLKQEQIGSRPNVKPQNWWRHWWCKVPQTSRESETDVFVVLENRTSNSRLGIHFEAKYGASLSPTQASDYRKRAEFMSGKEKYLNYTKWAVCFIAPEREVIRFIELQKYFDASITFEELGNFVPAFASNHQTLST